MVIVVHMIKYVYLGHIYILLDSKRVNAVLHFSVPIPDVEA
jgi:hypothetical protein